MATKTKNTEVKINKTPRIRKAAKAKEILETLPVAPVETAPVEIVHAPALAVAVEIPVESNVPMPAMPKRREVKRIQTCPKNRVVKGLRCESVTVFRYREIFNGNVLALVTSQAVARLGINETFSQWHLKQAARN